MMKPIHCAWGIDLPGREQRGHRFTASAVRNVKLPDLNFYMHHSRLNDGGARRVQASTCPAPPCGTGTSPPGAGNLEGCPRAAAVSAPRLRWDLHSAAPMPWWAAGVLGVPGGGAGGCRDPDHLHPPEHGEGSCTTVSL